MSKVFLKSLFQCPTLCDLAKLFYPQCPVLHLPAQECTALNFTALHCSALHRCSHCTLHLKYRADSPTRPLQPCTVLCSVVQKAVGAGCTHFLVCPARLQGLLLLQCGQQGITCGWPELGPAILGLEATTLPSCWHF